MYRLLAVAFFGLTFWLWGCGGTNPAKSESTQSYTIDWGTHIGDALKFVLENLPAPVAVKALTGVYPDTIYIEVSYSIGGYIETIGLRIDPAQGIAYGSSNRQYLAGTYTARVTARYSNPSQTVTAQQSFTLTAGQTTVVRLTFQANAAIGPGFVLELPRKPSSLEVFLSPLNPPAQTIPTGQDSLNLLAINFWAKGDTVRTSRLVVEKQGTGTDSLFQNKIVYVRDSSGAILGSGTIADTIWNGVSRKLAFITTASFAQKENVETLTFWSFRDPGHTTSGQTVQLSLLAVTTTGQIVGTFPIAGNAQTMP